MADHADPIDQGRW